MNIHIQSIPHKQQRYVTCGDWYINLAGQMIISVSEELPPASQLLVAIHEFSEAYSCMANGVTQKQVDDFDFTFKGEGEPGDCKDAPYHVQHKFAMAIEMIQAEAMNADWLKHAEAVESL